MFIIDRKDLALKLNLSLKKLTYLLYIKKPDNCYTTFEIPKKDGSCRIINAPNNELKYVQKKLAQLLYKEQQRLWDEKKISPNVSHGFEKNKTIITNAKIHRNKRYLLNLDLEDFFQSFHFGRVMGYFEKNENFKLDKKMAATIAQITCYKGTLPQGSPTSPVITNLICQILDFKLLHVAKKYKLDYTRYADDLTFSTNNKHFLESKEDFSKEIEEIISKSGFKINGKKTRLQYSSSKQKVTGLVVNQKINVDTVYFRNTKAMAYSLYTKNKFFIDNTEGSIAQLEGRFSFINSIDKYNNKLDEIVKNKCFDLNFREREYQKFLFYRLFWCNEKPLIITEGKTDIIYIKAALKKYYKDYPNLISLKSNGIFEYNISFFKRNKRVKYFFNIYEDGADTLNNLYRFYFDEKAKSEKIKSYYNIFSKYKTAPSNPIILIYDNEINSKDKPIYKSLVYKSLKDEEKLRFQKECRSSAINNSNLYLLTNPLVEEKKVCEIEDLFDKETLNIIINGRKFKRDVTKSDNSHYGKNDFAEHIANNYQSIDFSNFKSILDNINQIIMEFNNQKNN